MPFPALNFSDLKQPETLDAIRARIVAGLAANGCPVSQWAPSAAGGVENRIVDMAAASIQQTAAQRVADVATTRFLDLAEKLQLDYLAKRFYGGIERRPATYTIQNVFLSSVKLAPPLTYAAGRFRVRGVSNVYINIDPFTLPSGTGLTPDLPRPLPVRFRGENPGAAYDDPAGTVNRLVTAPAGVRCVNGPPSDFLPPNLVGTSTGTIAAQFASGPVSFGFLRIKIRSTGNVGSATFDYTTDAMTSYVSGGPIPASATIAGAFLSFRNGAVNPSFLAGDTFTILVADAILQRGNDAESDESLRTKCRARWTSLSDVPLGLTIQLWAQLASDEVHRVFADGDPADPGGIIAVIASQAGPASPAAVIAVQDFITARLAGYKGVAGLEESILVQSAQKFPLTPAGTVTVPREKLKATQIAADVNWRAYLGTVGVGGTVVFDRFVQAIMDAGATDADGLTLNGGTADIPLDTFSVPVPADGTTLPATLSWSPT